MGQIVFFTVGEDECRAWAVAKGATAPQGAGQIHTDLERGFVRAEVVSYEDFAVHKSDVKVKEAGKLRLEGRDYVMRDGGMIHIRFKV